MDPSNTIQRTGTSGQSGSIGRPGTAPLTDSLSRTNNLQRRSDSFLRSDVQQQSNALPRGDAQGTLERSNAQARAEALDQKNAAIDDLLQRAGRHDTTVHERVAPAVTEETVLNTHHEEATEAIEREVHQYHYHTSIQPIHHEEILPEVHEHQIEEVQVKEFNHGDEDAVKELLAKQAAVFKDSQTEGETKRTSSVAPAVTGEHIHHHVHEIIQPIVKKSTIIPKVIHRTIPIREVHHNEAKHHSATSLAPITLSDFTGQGGVLNGRAERIDGFEGEPKGDLASSARRSPVQSLVSSIEARTSGGRRESSTPYRNDKRRSTFGSRIADQGYGVGRGY